MSDTVTNNPSNKYRLGWAARPKRTGLATSGSTRYAALARYFNLAVAFAAVLGFLFFLSAAPNAAEQVRILALGDSLTAGYGLDVEDGFTAQLQRKLKSLGHEVRVLNGGVSGDTSAGGLARLDWALADRPTHAIVELGANDGLRGLDPAAMRRNLDAIIGRLRGADIPVLLAGMRAPPNLGRSYTTSFNRVFPELAEKHGVVFYPFFLSGVASRPTLNLRDGIHPNREGIAILVDRIAPYVVRLLNKRKQD